MSELTSRVLAWQRSGTFEEVEGHRIFVRKRPGADDTQPVLLLHGYTSSSFDST